MKPMLHIRDDHVAVTRTVILTAVLLLLVCSRADAQNQNNLSLTQIANELLQPIGFVAPGDGSRRMFIIEQPGVIRIYNIATRNVNATPFLDIASLVDNASNEQGLLGLAFHPDYATNGRFYVNYTRDPGEGDDLTVVAEYSVSANPDIALTAQTTLLEIPQDAGNHNGGDLHFGPDGYLYIAMGDGGGGDDEFDHAQDISTLKGAMLRIDVDGAPAVGDVLCGQVQNYGIPEGNPFIDTAGCDEIWSYGLRNPFRFSFDALTGDMFIGDVGQRLWEEIDFEPAGVGGRNYGWSCREGAHDFVNGNACVVPQNERTEPVLEYSHTFGCSVTGGYVYRGDVAPFHGLYFYGDYCSDRVWFAENNGGNWVATEWTTARFILDSIASFGEDEDGVLYIADRNDGAIYRINIVDPVFGDSFED